MMNVTEDQEKRTLVFVSAFIGFLIFSIAPRFPALLNSPEKVRMVTCLIKFSKSVFQSLELTDKLSCF